jgi:hypothetical protein
MNWELGIRNYELGVISYELGIGNYELIVLGLIKKYLQKTPFHNLDSRNFNSKFKKVFYEGKIKN